MEQDVKTVCAPQKKYFRQRAHSNPLADHSFLYPVCPAAMNWHPFYPNYFTPDGSSCNNLEKVEIVDIGCGYGGMLITLSPLFTKSLILGMEIRVKVSAFVHQRILALRNQGNKNDFQNIAVIRTNAMKYMTNFFNKGQLKCLFFLFPDPHFKKKKNKWRIISSTLLSEYAYVMAEGGIVYTMTDVLELHEWMKTHFVEHPLFEQLTAEQYSCDPVVEKLYESTEEGKKVTRNNGNKYLAIFRRLPNPI
ncbi:tRNA (guanine-N(7)-)-methyltransferase [Hydra vulgaris]|uniref:tRNA (guanine-N(7)-)-methyltransferase n=1 Tax=Hydra vulgaris TaxID=6087 RepID=A0ABM4DIM2_HYDVU